MNSPEVLLKYAEKLYNIAMKDLDEVQDYNKELEKKNAELEQELENYKLDAERYRFLRHGDNDECCYGQYTYSKGDCEIIERFLLRGEKLDERIDKNMQIEKEYYAGFGVQYD